MRYSQDKEEIIDVFNVLNRLLGLSINEIYFDFKNTKRTITKESQSIDIKTVENEIIKFQFDSCYLIREEEFFIIIQQAKKI